MKKNVTKFRGSRTCGGGTHKNRRGAGSRGGHGNAGNDKHHFVRNFLQGYTFGKHGFKRPQKVISYKSIVNVGELDEMAQQLVLDEQARKEDDVYYINLAELEYPIDKLLGTGKAAKSMIITVADCSDKARSRIEEAGGRIEEYIPQDAEQVDQIEQVSESTQEQ
ncbi:MAG: 50S ribosomal protein L15 [Methanosarcinales archaeon]|nr:50S ribosomal protein L15 [Methanosarcinales archaeon]